MTTRQHVDETARFLVESWRTGKRRGPLDDRIVPATMADAYAVQDRLFELLGGRLGGWKIAMWEPHVLQRWGLSEPTSGRVFADAIQRSPVRVDAGSLAGGTAMSEPEVAFRIGTTLEPSDSPFDADTIRQAIASVMPSVELATRHFEDLGSAGALGLVADNANGRGMAIGAEHPFDGTDTGAAIEVEMIVNGSSVEDGRGRTTVDEQVARIGWLAQHLAARGIALEAGALVTTGGSAGPQLLGRTDHLLADYGAFGSVEVTII